MQLGHLPQTAEKIGVLFQFNPENLIPRKANNSRVHMGLPLHPSPCHMGRCKEMLMNTIHIKHCHLAFFFFFPWRRHKEKLCSNLEQWGMIVPQLANNDVWRERLLNSQIKTGSFKPRTFRHNTRWSCQCGFTAQSSSENIWWQIPRPIKGTPSGVKTLTSQNFTKLNQIH